MAAPRFSSLSKNQQLAIAIGVPALIAVALGVFAYQKLGILGPDPDLPPMVQRTTDPESLYARINVLLEEIDKQDQIIKRKPLRERELIALQKDIAQAENLLPRDKEVLEIVQKLSEMGRQIPSDVGTVQVGAVVIKESGSAASQSGRGAANANELPQVVYEIDIDGTTNGIIKYIDSIERFPQRFMAVTNIVIKPGKPTASDKEVLHHAKLTLVTYTYQPKQAGRK
jgi:hypothetical protein